MRERLPICRNHTSNATHNFDGGGPCAPFSPYDADFGLGSSHWMPQVPAFSGITADVIVDTVNELNPGSSPLIVAEGRGGAGNLEFTFGLVHASNTPQLKYPKYTALQYIFLQPKLGILAELVNATCFCPPSVPVCWYSWLCLVLDQAVFTLLAPVDLGWTALTLDAVNYLFTNQNAGYLTVAYHILGPAVFSKYRPFLDFFDET